MSREDFVRAQGADFRSHMAKIFIGCGPDLGLKVIERQIWEAAQLCTEVHGAKVVTGLLNRVEFALHLDVPPDLDLTGIPDGDAPDPLVQALEGLVTIGEQNRQTIAVLARANLELAGQVAQVVELLKSGASA